MWIVDSSVWIDFLGGRTTPATTVLRASLGVRLLGVGDLILCEVLQGIRAPHEYARVKQVLLRLPVYTVGGREIALQAAENYRALRADGITVRKTIDCLIATFVIERGFALLHSDRDFAPFVALGLAEVEV
jgi:predicted nucleic acid-binding protein